VNEVLRILRSYLITFGWAVVGSVGLGVGVFVALSIFDLCTTRVDEWELIKNGSIPMAIVLAAIIIGCAIVVAACVLPPLQP